MDKMQVRDMHNKQLCKDPKFWKEDLMILYMRLHKFDPNRFTSYSNNTGKSAELLELKKDPHKIFVASAYNDDDSVIAYIGDVEQMRQNIEQLRLPSFSENLGEQIFSMFDGKLQNLSGPIHLEAKLIPCTAMDLELVLRKQLYVWNTGRAVDEAFFKEYESSRK